MRRFCFLFLVLCLATAFAVAAAGRGGDERLRNVVLIGWDGAQRNHVKECLGRGELPNLKKLSSEGNLVAIDIFRTTDTKSGWAQILTGYEPEITGVYSNGRYQPIPKGLTVFERLEQFFGPHNIATVAIIGKTEHVGANPPKKTPIADPKKDAKGKVVTGDKDITKDGKIVEENGVRYLVVPGKPYYITKDNMDLFLNGLGVNDNVGAKALEYLEKYKSKAFFFFIHFADVDHKGHKSGENSKEYNDALISCDTWLGKIVKFLKDNGLYEETLVYVTADHGFDEGMTGHGDAPYVFLGTNDAKVMRRGTREDITPTILDRFGVDLGKLKPPLDGRPLTKAYTQAIW